MTTRTAAPGRTGRHRPRTPGPTAKSAGVTIALLTAAATWIGILHHSSPPRQSATPAAMALLPVKALMMQSRSHMRLVIDRHDRRSCPRRASACVDLKDRLTWLQRDGRISYGPVRMEPGPPDTRHATPRGVFHVSWKTGPTYVSIVYGDPMPYAVFFGPDGIAFHGGSLTAYSHGCVHLSVRNARYYNEHLVSGAEVVVF